MGFYFVYVISSLKMIDSKVYVKQQDIVREKTVKSNSLGDREIDYGNECSKSFNPILHPHSLLS